MHQPSSPASTSPRLFACFVRKSDPPIPTPYPHPSFVVLSSLAASASRNFDPRCTHTQSFGHALHPYPYPTPGHPPTTPLQLLHATYRIYASLFLTTSSSWSVRALDPRHAREQLAAASFRVPASIAHPPVSVTLYTNPIPYRTRSRLIEAPQLGQAAGQTSCQDTQDWPPPPGGSDAG